MYALLKDGTRVDGLLNSSIPTDIVVERDTYGGAASVRDLFTSANSSVVRIFDGSEEVSVGADLVLQDNISIVKSSNGVICEIFLREKTTTEIMQDQIAELQEAIIEE